MDSFIVQKCTPWKGAKKNLDRAPPSPSFGQNPKASIFSQENVRPLAASVASSLMHRIVNRQRIELRFKERSERRRRKLPAISSENFFNRQNGSRVRETFQIREAVDKKKRRGHRGWGLFSKHKNSLSVKGRNASWAEYQKYGVRQKSGLNIFIWLRGRTP